jgi:uncharacterized protein (DUF427 family)
MRQTVFQTPAPAVEPTPRWVRVRVAGTWLADSRRALLLTWFGPGRLPTYCFPPGDVRADLLTGAGDTAPDGVSTRYDLTVDGRTLAGAASVFQDPPPQLADLRDHVTFSWRDPEVEWFEEAQPVFAHPRVPTHRVDAVPSERHVRIEVDGVTLAESGRPVAVFETGLPTRWYLPREDVRMDLLEPTGTVTACPYKGTARWWSARTPAGTRTDLAWSYPEPVVEAPLLAGLVAFFDEHVDVHLDGAPQARPRTPWSDSPAATPR